MMNGEGKKVMRSNSFIRHLVEGIKSFLMNKWMSFAAISALSFMLLLIGVTGVILFNINHVANKIEKDVDIRLYLSETSYKEQKQIIDQLHSFSTIESIKYIPKEEGLQDFMKTFGSDGEAFQSLKDDNPLNDVLVIKTKKPQQVEATAQKIKKMKNLEKVEYGEDIVKPLFKTTGLIRTIGLIFIAGLTLVSFLVVSNTIKLTVITRKKEIQLQKLIGATTNFIRAPFFIEGSIIGLLGSFIPITLLSMGYSWFYKGINSSLDVPVIELVSPFPFIMIFSTAILFFGVLIGIWGATSSLRKYLKV